MCAKMRLLLKFIMKIAVVGTGYVGLVTGTCLAEVGHSVICVDVDETKIARLSLGEIPIYEPGLQELVARNVKEKRLSFTTSFKEAVEVSEVIFNAVGTPMGENHEADLRYVMQVARDFAERAKGYKVFVTKSTVPVGTGLEVAEVISATIKKREGGDGVEFDVVSNPEFLREGTAVKDFMNPDRIIVGLDSERSDASRARRVMEKVYEPIVRVGSPLIFTDLRSAEIIKYASNAFLATKISFINEIANFCECVGGDVKEVARGMGLDKRIGSKFLHAGLGYGGSCFPKDVAALIQSGKKTGGDKADCTFSILQAVEGVNRSQRERFVEKIRCAVGGELKGKIFAVWGLSFKPKTDDVREAPALTVVPQLVKEGATVRAFDPVAMENCKAVLEGMKLTAITYASNAYDACNGADALVIFTEWDEFRVVDFDRLKGTMKGRVIVDGRNLYERRDIESFGFIYHCFGR